jgi:hypothetical protein
MTQSIWVVTGTSEVRRRAYAIFLNAVDAALYTDAYPIKEPRIHTFELGSRTLRSGQYAHVSLDARNNGTVLYAGQDEATAIRYARRGSYPPNWARQAIPVDPLVNETRQRQLLYKISFCGNKPLSAARVYMPMVDEARWVVGISAHWSGSNGCIEHAWTLAASEDQAIDQVSRLSSFLFHA